MTNDLGLGKEITPAEMIREAVRGNADLDKLKQLLEIQKDWEANEARKSYAKSFAIAQAHILPVIKRKFNKQTQSNYAELSNIIETAQPIYTNEGFSVTFDEGDCPKDGHARILANVLHYQGHKEQYHLDIPLDGVGIKGNANMTPIHGKASCVSYGKKYLLCMIWNIPTSDIDGNIIQKETISQQQLSTLLDLINAKELSEKQINEYLKIEKLEDLPASEYMKAMSAINIAKKVTK